MIIYNAIAKALISASTEVVTCVPGFGGTQIFNALQSQSGRPPVFSFHEEVAYSAAHGAAISGSRSGMLCKVHGLAKAANAITDSLYMSFEGAMIVLVFEDKHGSHSDNILAAEPLLKGMRIPYFAPQKEEILSTVYAAFQKSENLKIPVAILLDADVVNEEITFTECPFEFQKGQFERNLYNHLVVPVFAKYQHKVMEERLAGRDFNGIEKPPVPRLPDGLPPDYAEYVRPYIPLMEQFRKIRGKIVFGDTGISTLFAFPPFKCVDSCSYMGGSVAMATGATLAGYHDTWAVTGDFSFIAAGHLGLIEAAARNLPVKILIFNNNKAQTTGGQQFNGDILQRLLRGFEDYILEIPDPDNPDNVRKILNRAASSDKIQVVVAHFDKYI